MADMNRAQVRRCLVASFCGFLCITLFAGHGGGCAPRPANFRYCTEIDLPIDSQPELDATLNGLDSQLVADGFEVRRAGNRLSAERECRFEVVAGPERTENYSLRVSAQGRAAWPAHLSVRIEGETESLSLWAHERRWTPWKANAAREIRAKIDKLTKSVSFAWPRPDAG